MRTVLVGYGEIGKGASEVYNINDIHDPNHGYEAKGEFDILFVAIPYSENFIKIVKDYQDKFKVKATVIFSTVPIGTCRQLMAVHSPVEGKHPYLAESMRIMPRWLGGYNILVDEFFKKYNTVKVDKPEITELLKLQSTTMYGINIEYARYIKGVCDKLDIDYENIKKFNQDYNILYKELKMPQFQRYILDAPVGKKGGHCITPNAVILNKQFPDCMVKRVAEQ